MNIKRYRTIQLTLFGILLLNLLVAGAKIFMGSLTKSSAIMADGFHSVSDASGNVIGLIAMVFASKPEDEDHPYGHGKIEMLGSFIIVLILMLLGFEIIMSAVSKLINPVSIVFNPLSFGVMIATLMINIIVYKTEFSIGVKMNSSILKVDALHTKNDVLVTVGVIASMILISLGFPLWIDGIISLVIAANIFKAAWGMFLEVSPILLDAQMMDTKIIDDLLKHFAEIKEIHKVRSHGTLDSMMVDMHVNVDPKMSVLDAHNLSHEIEKFIASYYEDKKISVICHLEPYGVATKRKDIDNEA